MAYARRMEDGGWRMGYGVWREYRGNMEGVWRMEDGGVVGR
jgi:hypothetical protein